MPMMPVSVLANHVNTLGVAEECLQRGDHDYAVVILQPLLEHPEKNDLETMLEVARLLELCGKRRLAAEALIHATRLDYGAAQAWVVCARVATLGLIAQGRVKYPEITASLDLGLSRL